MESRIKIGLFGVGGKLTIKDGYINYSHPYGKFFRVKVDDIETVAIDSLKFGKCELKIVGRGTDLAKVEMPLGWASKCQEWILSQKSK